MGIVGSETASSAQLKKAEKIVVGIGDSGMGTGDDSGKVTVGSEGSVCVDIDADEDREIRGGFD